MGPLGSSLFSLLHRLGTYFTILSLCFSNITVETLSWIRQSCTKYLERLPPSYRNHYCMGWKTANALPSNLLMCILCFFIGAATMRLWSLNLLFIKCFQDCFHQIILATYNCWALRRWCSFNMDLLFAAIIACPAFLKIKPWWFNRAISKSVLIRRMLWIMDLHFASLGGLMKMKRIDRWHLFSLFELHLKPGQRCECHHWPDLLLFPLLV